MDKQKEIEIKELTALLLEKSVKADVKPVFKAENGEEYLITDKNALKVLNEILEQAFLPFLAEETINAGYGDVKQYQDEIDRLQTELAHCKEKALTEFVEALMALSFKTDIKGIGIVTGVSDFVINKTLKEFLKQ